MHGVRGKGTTKKRRIVIGRDIEKWAKVMPPREPMSLRATDHGVIAQEYTNGGRALLIDLEMDYEKAYKAVLQTATQWIKDGCTDKEKICLECVFPELRESEDERMRKCLIHYLRGEEDECEFNIPAMLAYLEKQKESHIPWYDYQKSKEAGYTIVPNEEYEQLIKQKEQNPALSKEDERIRKWLLELVESQEPKTFIEVNKLDVFAWLEKQKEQKPAEWSGEDEKIIRSIRHILFEYAFENGGVDVNGDYCEGVYIQANDFLLSLRPSWKPSEEQMEALKELIDDANRDGWVTPGATALYEQLKKL